MLNNVAINANKAMRAVVLRHPNSIDVAVYRKRVKRLDNGFTPGEMGGLPTLGGMGVLSGEDEEDFDYSEMGDGKLLPCEPFTPSTMVDRNDGIDGAEGVFLYCMIEPTAQPADLSYFDIKKHDVVFMVVWEGVYIGYEVVDLDTTVNVPPYCRRFILNKRDDLKFLGLAPEVSRPEI